MASWKWWNLSCTFEGKYICQKMVRTHIASILKQSDFLIMLHLVICLRENHAFYWMLAVYFFHLFNCPPILHYRKYVGLIWLWENSVWIHFVMNTSLISCQDQSGSCLWPNSPAYLRARCFEVCWSPIKHYFSFSNKHPQGTKYLKAYILGWQNVPSLGQQYLRWTWTTM